jgi:initiation factor 1A
MVKNVKGGSGHKSQARKYSDNGTKPNAKTRISEDENELYGQITAMLGNGMCHVLCIDTKKRLCIIRGKFRGRGKRDNTLSNGKWVLVGRRDFETERSGEGRDLEKCDLLEVYSDVDKDRLKSQVHVDWSAFIQNEQLLNHTTGTSDDINFTDEREDEYVKLMENELTALGKTNTKITIVGMEDEEDIDVDDI